MKFLQRVESGDHIFVFGELFGSFAEADFYFEVLFEVVGAHFVVETQQVIDLLHVVVEVFPRFGDVLGGDVADFLPFGLQGFEAVVFFVDLFGLCHHLFEFVDEGELFFQVGLACGFGFGGDFGAHFFDRSDEAFVFLFVGIDRGERNLRLYRPRPQRLRGLCRFRRCAADRKRCAGDRGWRDRRFRVAPHTAAGA